MALIKTGDNKPIIACYDSSGKKQVCPKCGKPLVVVAIDGSTNDLICEECEAKDAE
jgi:hypothetical protein